MHESGRSNDAAQLITAVGGGHSEGTKYAASILEAEAEDLLAYIGDHVAELEAMAVSAKLDSVTDLLGYAAREIERTRRRLRKDAS